MLERLSGSRFLTPHLVGVPTLEKLLEPNIKLISEVTGCLTKPNAALAFLSIGKGDFPIDYRTVVIHILFTARLMILKVERFSSS